MKWKFKLVFIFRTIALCKWDCLLTFWSSIISHEAWPCIVFHILVEIEEFLILPVWHWIFGDIGYLYQWLQVNIRSDFFGYNTSTMPKQNDNLTMLSWKLEFFFSPGIWSPSSVVLPLFTCHYTICLHWDGMCGHISAFLLEQAQMPNMLSLGISEFFKFHKTCLI